MRKTDSSDSWSHRNVDSQDCKVFLFHQIYTQGYFATRTISHLSHINVQCILHILIYIYISNDIYKYANIIT